MMGVAFVYSRLGIKSWKMEGRCALRRGLSTQDVPSCRFILPAPLDLARLVCTQEVPIVPAQRYGGCEHTHT